MINPPSGEQWEIAHGEQRATIVEVGGGVRAYDHAERPVLDPYPLEMMCDGAHGAPLIPWPNRLADGRFSFDGQELQLALTEPATHNAIHGLLRWRPWRLLEREESRVRVGTRLFPMQGWPFPLDASITYSLSGDGLRVRTEVSNLGEREAPLAVGQHPYLSPGAGAHVDDARLELRAATRIVTDSERQLPVGREAVAGSPYDFNSPRAIGQTRIDYPFTDLPRDERGLAWVRLEGPDGHTVAFWQDPAYPIVELYTGDTLAPPRRRLGLGCEPMSAPPNALASGEGTVRLAPGESWRGEWGVRLE
jgi:aldose 1-epimerase